MIPTASHIPTVAVSSRSKVQQRSCAWCAADEGAAHGWLRAQFVDRGRPDLFTIETRRVCVCVPATGQPFKLPTPQASVATADTNNLRAQCYKQAVGVFAFRSSVISLGAVLLVLLVAARTIGVVVVRSLGALGEGTPHPVQAIALGRHTFRLTHLDVAGKREDRVDNLKQEHRIAY